MYIVLFDYFGVPQYRLFSSYDDVVDFFSNSTDGSISRIYVRQMSGDELAILGIKK